MRDCCKQHQRVEQKLQAIGNERMKSLLLGVLEQARETCGTGTVGNGNPLSRGFKLVVRRGR